MSPHPHGRPAEPAGHCNTEVDVLIAGIVRDAQRKGDGLCWRKECRLCSEGWCGESFVSSVSTHFPTHGAEWVAMRFDSRAGAERGLV